MIAMKVSMQATHEPVKRTPVVPRLDADGSQTPPAQTNRAGIAWFDLPPTSGRVLLSRLQRYDGRLDGETPSEPRAPMENRADEQAVTVTVEDRSAHTSRLKRRAIRSRHCHCLFKGGTNTG